MAWHGTGHPTHPPPPPWVHHLLAATGTCSWYRLPPLSLSLLPPYLARTYPLLLLQFALSSSRGTSSHCQPTLLPCLTRLRSRLPPPPPGVLTTFPYATHVPIPKSIDRIDGRPFVILLLQRRPLHHYSSLPVILGSLYLDHLNNYCYAESILASMPQGTSNGLRHIPPPDAIVSGSLCFGDNISATSTIPTTVNTSSRGTTSPP